MDVLSDVLAAVRVGRPHSARVEHSGPFGRRLAAADGAGFHVVLAGACRLVGPEGRSFVLGAGDVAFLPRGVAHTLTDDRSPSPRGGATGGPGTAPAPTVLLCAAYLFDTSRTHPLLAALPEVVHLPARAGHHPELRAAVDLLGGELERARPGADAAVPALLDVLLLFTLRAWWEDRAGPGDGSGWAQALRDPAVSGALQALHDDPARPWTVEGLARVAGLSRAAFARRFGALVGRPPLGYLTGWRMTLAAGLLRDTDLPLAAIAPQVGYASEFAFAHAFAREIGVAPGRYRQRAAGPAPADRARERPGHGADRAHAVE